MLGQAVGRWGNFVNQEAFGSNTTLPWGMYSSETSAYLFSKQSELMQQGITVDPTMPVHPCFLYESLWCILGFVLLHFYSKRRRFNGEIFLAYLVWYGLGRFFIEGLRTDSLMLGNMRISQLVAGICVVVGIICIIILRSKYKETSDDRVYEAVYGDIVTDYDDDPVEMEMGAETVDDSSSIEIQTDTNQSIQEQKNETGKDEKHGTDN